MVFWFRRNKKETRSAPLLKNVLTPDVVRIPLNANDKEGIIRELIDILDAKNRLPDRAAAEKVVFEREANMSTGMENGVAIPHGKTDTVDRLHVAMGLKPEGVDFGCVDGEPARILILTLSPASTSGPHIRFMAEITRLLQQEALRRRLLACRTPEEAIHVIQGDTG